MQSIIRIPQGWEQPKFWLGQRTQQGIIIGVEYCAPDSAVAEENGIGWSYAVVKNKNAENIFYYSAAGLKLLSDDELQQELQQELEEYEQKVRVIQEQLAAINGGSDNA